MFKKIIFAISLLAIGPMVMAGEWTGEGKILQIYPSTTNNGVLIKHEFMKNPDNCSPASFLVLDKNHMFFSELFSLLMSAQARNANINLHINGCAGANGASPAITLVIAK